jgi:hypothetical protein
VRADCAELRAKVGELAADANTYLLPHTIVPRDDGSDDSERLIVDLGRFVCQHPVGRS